MSLLFSYRNITLVIIKVQSSASSIVKSCSIVGTTLEMNLRKKKRLFSTRGSPPLLCIWSIIFFITVAWLHG